jgi:hypothetical protein
MEKVSSVDMGIYRVNMSRCSVETGLGEIEELRGAVGEEEVK